MSYTKNDAEKTINFTYQTDNIFDSVSMRTLYRAKNIKTEQGIDLTDEYAITEDERNLVTSYLKTASFEVLQEVLKITQRASDAIDLTAIGEGGSISITIKDKESYNENLLDLIDTRIEECLTLFCIKDWYRHCGLGEEYKLSVSEYDEEKIKLNNNLFQLKKPTIA